MLYNKRLINSLWSSIMDLENLIEQVAERVVAKLTAANRIIAKRPRAGTDAVMGQILDSLVLGDTVMAGAKEFSIPAITKHQLLELLAISGVNHVQNATLTAALKARGVEPFISSKSNDSRHRFWIHGVQTQCYAFSPAIRDAADLLAEISIVSTKYPQLCPNYGKY